MSFCAVSGIMTLLRGYVFEQKCNCQFTIVNYCIIAMWPCRILLYNDIYFYIAHLNLRK